MTHQIGKLMALASKVSAAIFEVVHDDAVDTYYWCCDSCGACGKHHLGYATAASEADTHITTYH